MKKISVLFILLLTAFQNCSVDGFKSLESLRAKPVSYSPTRYSSALFSASNVLTNRLPAQSDLENLTSVRNYEAALRIYMESTQFRDVMVAEHKSYLQVGGTRLGSTIDYDLPARIGAYLISTNQSYDNVLKTTYCVDSNFNVTTTCNDTFSEAASADTYGAGVISTQSFISLYKTSARFNFGLVVRVSKGFLCSTYPDGMDSGMTQAEVSNDIHPFGEVGNLKSGNQTGSCYACHRTLNPRAAMFYNFDGEGKFVMQTDTGSTVRETLEASKVSDLIKGPAKILGRRVANIRDYGDAITKDPRFADCMTLRYFNFMTGHKLSYLPAEFKYLSDNFKKKNFNVKELLVEIAKSPYFIDRLPLR
jgi:hypothetical protein